MQTVDLLLHARWVVPVEPDGVLEHHSVAVDNGRIEALLPYSEAGRRFRARQEQHLDGQLLLPGLINAHTHAAMTLMRGLADDLPLMTWLSEHIWPAEARLLSADYVRAGTELALLEQLRCGVTCFNDMYFFPDTVADSVLAAGMRAVIGLIAFDFPSAWGAGPADYIAKGEALLAAHADQPLLHFALAPHAPYTVGDDTLVKLQALAESHDLPLHIHVHETAAEVEQAVANDGRRPLARLDQLGLLTPRLLAVHMTQLTEAEIERFAAAGGHILHCPESNLKLASGFCPVARLQQAGVNVAVGTDGAASNNDLDMLGELRTAAILAKAVAGSAAAVPAAEALRMATFNGARALGLADRIGSLEVGKQADLIAVDLNEPETEPLFNPVSQLVYAAGRHQVSNVWVAGRQLLADRQATTLDAERIRAVAREWRDRVAG